MIYFSALKFSIHDCISKTASFQSVHLSGGSGLVSRWLDLFTRPCRWGFGISSIQHNNVRLEFFSSTWQRSPSWTPRPRWPRVLLPEGGPGAAMKAAVTLECLLKRPLCQMHVWCCASAQVFAFIPFVLRWPWIELLPYVVRKGHSWPRH